jgi:hypothetical protein
MAATSHSLKREVEELVLEQIHALKQQATMNDRDILEYHLRHYRIMVIYWHLDRVSRMDEPSRQGRFV